MNRRFHWMLVPAAALALGACAMQPEAEEVLTPLMEADDARLQTYRIEDWEAPNNQTLIVEALDGTMYRAQFLSDCIGLQFTTTIGFVTRGTNAIDEFSGIVLPDGTRCYFQSFNRVASPERTAELEEEE